MIENIVQNVCRLWDAEATIAELKLRQLIVSTFLKALASVIVAFGILMLNVSGFFVMARYVDGGLAAGLVGLFDFFLAAALVLYANKRKTHEMTIALRRRGEALQGLNENYHTVEGQISSVTAELISARAFVTKVFKDPIREGVSYLIELILAALPNRPETQQTRPSTASPSKPSRRNRKS